MKWKHIIVAALIALAIALGIASAHAYPTSECPASYGASCTGGR